MKKLIILVILLIAYPAIADQWCEWSGTTGENCQSDSRGYIIINGVNTRTPAIAHAKGWYKLTVTQPTVGADQVRDAEVWALADNQMSLTWTVRAMTTAEINEREAEAMPLSEYFLWKLIIAKGVATQAEIVTYLQANAPELIDAYIARKALLGD